MIVKLLCVLIVFILIKQNRNVLKMFPKSKGEVISLYNSFKNVENKRQIIKVYFPALAILLLIFIGATLVKLEIKSILMLLLFQVCLSPFIIQWNVNHLNSINEYRNLCSYLSQFILIFKSHNKILYTLDELSGTMGPKIDGLISNMIASIQRGSNISSSMQILSDVYPHFIVHNLNSLVVNVETYGGQDYFDALNLIQDDVDDWLDDLEAYYSSKERLVKRVNILVMFAYFISYIAVNMLFTVSLEIDGIMYQNAIVLFFIVEMITYLLSQYLLNDYFIDKSEIIC